MADIPRRAGHRRGPVPRALAWAVLAGGLALSWAGVQRQVPPVAATAEAVAATGALLEAWRAGDAAAAGAWLAPAAAGPGGAWLAGLSASLPGRLPMDLPRDPVPGAGSPAGGTVSALPGSAGGSSPGGLAAASAPGWSAPVLPDGGAGAPGSPAGSTVSALPGSAGGGPPADHAAPPAPGSPSTGSQAAGRSPAADAIPAGFLRTPATGYTVGPARPDALGRIQVAALVDVAWPEAGYAGRLAQDLRWRPLLAGPRLVAASTRAVLEVAVQGDRLAWRREGGRWQPGLGLADLPLRAAPVGGPPGVEVDVSRQGFGPLALAGQRGLLLVTRGPRPLVALWVWPLDDPALEPGRDVVVLDVLYHARAIRWQVDAGGRRATLEVEAEDGSRVPVVYDLEAGGPVGTSSTASSGSAPQGG